MTSKRTLVKQKVTYGSVGDENLHESDDDFSGKGTSTKRVSFESHDLSDSDSDVENSLGRINRTSEKRTGDAIDGLFRETSTKEKESSVGLIEGISEESRGSKAKDEGKFSNNRLNIHNRIYWCNLAKFSKLLEKHCKISFF